MLTESVISMEFYQIK